MPSKLTSACSSIVSMVEPVAQRIQPSKRPKTKTCTMTYQ